MNKITLERIKDMFYIRFLTPNETVEVSTVDFPYAQKKHENVIMQSTDSVFCLSMDRKRIYQQHHNIKVQEYCWQLRTMYNRRALPITYQSTLQSQSIILLIHHEMFGKKWELDKTMQTLQWYCRPKYPCRLCHHYLTYTTIHSNWFSFSIE